MDVRDKLECGPYVDVRSTVVADGATSRSASAGRGGMFVADDKKERLLLKPVDGEQTAAKADTRCGHRHARKQGMLEACVIHQGLYRCETKVSYQYL